MYSFMFFTCFQSKTKSGKEESATDQGFIALFLKKSSEKCILITFNQNEYSTKAEYHGPYKENIRNRLECTITYMLIIVRQITE